MQATLEGIGKKFHNKWIFRNLDLTIKSGSHHAIVGSNGSGKSTLLMILAGYMAPSRGQVSWSINGQPLHPREVYQQVAICSPYLELIEEFSLEESLRFQQRFKPFRQQTSISQLLEMSGLEEHANQPIRHYSSGMKQRCRLLLSIMSQAGLLLLDEPCSNLDAAGIQWYQQMVQTHCINRSLVICSNHNTHEYQECKDIYSLS